MSGAHYRFRRSARSSISGCVIPDGGCRRETGSLRPPRRHRGYRARRRRRCAAGRARLKSGRRTPRGKYRHRRRPAGSTARSGVRWLRTRRDRRTRRFRLQHRRARTRARVPTATLQAPHLAVGVLARGVLTRLVTRIYFEDEPSNGERDPVLALVPAERRVDACWRRGSNPNDIASTSRCRAPARPCSSMLTFSVRIILTPSRACRRCLTSKQRSPSGSVGRGHSARGRAAIARAARAELFDTAALIESRTRGEPRDPIECDTADSRSPPRGSPTRRGYVHWGATSQDIIDTALVLQLRAAVPLVAADLSARRTPRRDTPERHVKTTMAGRTWLQQATPITFGLKAAGWCDALDRAAARV